MKLKNSLDAMSGVFITALGVMLCGATLACTTQAWEETKTGGVVSAGTAARFDGDCGLRLDLSGSSSGWVEDPTPGTLADVTEYVARFYAYVDDAQVASGETLTLFSARDSNANELFGLQLKGSGGDAVLDLYAYDDTTGIVDAEGDVVVPFGWRALALHWNTGSGTGAVSLSIDENNVQNISGLNNAGYSINKVFLGVVEGNSPGLSGVIDVDSFASRRTGTAGLVNRSCSGGEVDVSNITFLSGSKSCVASGGLVFGSRVTFDSGAVVDVDAQSATLTAGTRIPAGAILAIN